MKINVSKQVNQPEIYKLKNFNEYFCWVRTINRPYAKQEMKGNTYIMYYYMYTTFERKEAERQLN
jgi:hypothetical protein